MISFKLIKDYFNKKYICASCGTDKSVKYWKYLSNGDVIPCCNRCVFLNKNNRKEEKNHETDGEE